MREPSLGNLAWDKTFKNKQQIDLAHEILKYRGVRGTAAKSGFLATIFHKVKFSKGTVLKSEGLISHKHFLTFFLQQHFSF